MGNKENKDDKKWNKADLKGLGALAADVGEKVQELEDKQRMTRAAERALKPNQ